MWEIWVNYTYEIYSIKTDQYTVFLKINSVSVVYGIKFVSFVDSSNCPANIENATERILACTFDLPDGMRYTRRSFGNLLLTDDIIFRQKCLYDKMKTNFFLFFSFFFCVQRKYCKPSWKSLAFSALIILLKR